MAKTLKELLDMQVIVAQEIHAAKTKTTKGQQPKKGKNNGNSNNK